MAAGTKELALNTAATQEVYKIWRPEARILSVGSYRPLYDMSIIARPDILRPVLSGDWLVNKEESNNFGRSS
jgi:hypothetical protein